MLKFQWRATGGRRDHIPQVPTDWDRPGVYAIYLDRKLAYIGQSERVRTRLVSHLAGAHINMHVDHDAPAIVTQWGTVDRLTLKFKPSRRFGDRLMREARLIRRLRPVLNRRGVSVPLRAVR